MISCVESPLPSVRPTLTSSIYLVAVAVVAAVGFVEHSPLMILAAALLAAPASVVAVPGYYLLYGLLALLPGANPSASAGSGASTPDGNGLTSVVTGTPAAWFTITTQALGILALTVAALVNVVVFRMISARRSGASSELTGS